MLNKKSFYKLFGLLSIFTITTPIITTAVSCSYDWLGAGGPSGGTTDGNSRVIENNPEISTKQGKEYLDYEGRFGYEDGRWEVLGGYMQANWSEIYLTPDSFFETDSIFETYADRIDEFKWFEDDGEPVDYKITIDIEQPFYVSGDRAKFNKPISGSNLYFKSRKPTLMEFKLNRWRYSEGFTISDFDIIPIGSMKNDPLVQLSPLFSKKIDFILPLSNQIAARGYTYVKKRKDNYSFVDTNDVAASLISLLGIHIEENGRFILRNFFVKYITSDGPHDYYLDDFDKRNNEKFIKINNIISFKEDLNSNFVDITYELKKMNNFWKNIISDDSTNFRYIGNFFGKFSIKKM